MNKIFNSLNETSSRILLLLYALDNREKSSDFIAYIDYMSLYSKTLGIGTYDLHGDNPFRLSEFPSRITLTQKALKNLVFKGLCDASLEKGIILYKINKKGIKTANLFQTVYSKNYLNISIDLCDKYLTTSDNDILIFITTQIKEKGGMLND